MQRITIIVLAVASFVAFSAAAVMPQEKLYFSIPLGPAPAAPAEEETPAPGGEETTTAAPQQAQLNIMPLGQLLATLLTGLFGNTLPSQQAGAGTGAQLNIVPLGQALGMLFGGLFG